MKKLLIVLLPSLLVTGCAPALMTAAAMSRSRHSDHRYERPAAPSPVGRWDNVMMLDPGTPLKVLTMDGTVVTGRFVSANNKTLRLDAAKPEALAMTDVMRVDRTGTASGIVAKEGLKGAAVGAGVAGVAGLIVGAAPPPRVFAGAALVGGCIGATMQAGAPGLGTIYVALSPASSGGAPQDIEARIATPTFTPTVITNNRAEIPYPPDGRRICGRRYARDGRSKNDQAEQVRPASVPVRRRAGARSAIRHSVEKLPGPAHPPNGLRNEASPIRATATCSKARRPAGVSIRSGRRHPAKAARPMMTMP